MKNIEKTEGHYSSELINNLLDSISPEEQARIDCKMILASKIYAAMKVKGWKSLDLAKALNVKSPSIVSKWLSGTQNFTVDTLVDIQRVLDVKLIDVEGLHPASNLKVQYAVTVSPASITEAIYEPLQKVIDQTGGLQPTVVEVTE